MRFDTLTEWLEWQETCHPNEIDLGLDRVLSVYQRLAPSAIARKIITVAGTNGKGSSICFLENILRSAGYKVACYTSPHLFNYNERIQINGVVVTDQELCEVFEKIDQARIDPSGTEISITYFEFGTLAALLLMAEHDLDIAILEVGLGGRLDAVNIIDADIALITAIDLDHEAWLGSTKEKIAVEKAGIMREFHPVVYSDDVPAKSIKSYANSINAPLYSLNVEFSFQLEQSSWQWHGLSENRYTLPILPLKGVHQYNNISGVLMVLELLAATYPVSQSHLRQGILSSTIPGRLESVPGKVNTIVDVAHNPQAARALSNYLLENSCKGKIRIVISLMADKDIGAIVQQLTNKYISWYVTDLPMERAISAFDLITIISRIDASSQCFSYPCANLAYKQAVSDSQENDQIVIFGSFYLYHELKDELFNLA